MILGIETSGNTSSVALVADGQLQAERVFEARRVLNQLLSAQIADLCGGPPVEAKLDGFSGPVGTVIVENTETSNNFDLGYFTDMKSWQVAGDAFFYTKGV